MMQNVTEATNQSFRSDVFRNEERLTIRELSFDKIVQKIIRLRLELSTALHKKDN
jgi:hypothetical protein